MLKGSGRQGDGAERDGGGGGYADSRDGGTDGGGRDGGTDVSKEREGK